METSFTYGEVIGAGWEKMKKHFWFFVGLFVIICLVQGIPTGVANIFKEKMVVIYGLLIIVAWLLQVLVKMGTIKITLDILDKDSANFSTLFSLASLLIKFILGSILYCLIVLGGFILLIVPGIIWAVKYQFFAYT